MGDAHFMELLEMLMTPEEGKYLLELSKVKTPAEVAQIFNIDEKTATTKLDNLTRRGLLLRGGRSTWHGWTPTSLKPA